MKIALLADEVDQAMYEYHNFSKLEGVELIISCGDLPSSYLEYIVTLTNKPLLYVRGNHDSHYDQNPPLGCIPIDDTIFDYKGLYIVGLGGSLRYKPGKDMYSEFEMEKRIRKLKRKIKIVGGFDLFITHAPAAGYGDLQDLPHLGFSCFNDFLNTYHPYAMCYGHIHDAYGNTMKTLNHPSGTILYHTSTCTIIDIPNTIIKERKPKNKIHEYLSRKCIER